MRNLHELDKFRLRGAQALAAMGGWEGDETCGAFRVLSRTDGAPLHIIASTGLGWDHVSISRKTRCPNWPEMEQVAMLFFSPDEDAMQLHVPASEHINMHPFCLHWWRPQGVAIPRPPAILVGVGATPVRDLAESMARLKAAGL